MNFGQPWFLLGLLGASIPLLVHLFDKRRPKEVKFAALAFVLKSQKRSASRLRLRKILIYILRTLVLLAIPLALARPSCTGRNAAAATAGAMATAIVVDVSLATRFEGLHEKALQEARAAVSSLQTDEPAIVMACNDSPQVPFPLGFERQQLLKLIDDLQPQYTRVDFNRCIDVALEALSDSPLPQRRVVLVSAFTVNSLALEGAAPESVDSKGRAQKPEIVLRDIAKRELPNRALVDAKAELAPHLGSRGWQFIFTVKNFSPENLQNVPLNLFANGELVAKSFVDVGAMQTVQKTIGYRFAQSGLVTVLGQLEHDALPDDDERTLVLAVAPERLALIVNGAPSMQKVKDEAYFVESALSSFGSPVRAVVRDADAASREDLSKYDVVMLLNVKPPSTEFVTKLKEFVDANKGLFLSMGENTEPDAMNQAYQNLLPRTLRVVKTAVDGKQDTLGRPAQIDTLDSSHPLTSPFVGTAKEGLLAARFNKYVLFEGENKQVPSAVIAGLDDGAPLLVVSGTEKRKVAMFASSVDTDWSDIAIRTAFLPLIQRLAGWLSGALDERENSVAQVGQSATIRAQSTPVSTLQSASGRQVKIKSRDASEIVTEPLPEPGRYDAIDEKGKTIESLAFAAMIDPAASDLTRHNLEAVIHWFGESSVKSSQEFDLERKSSLTTWLLVGIVLALFAEGLLLRKPSWKSPRPSIERP
jgi:hypothetical protein